MLKYEEVIAEYERYIQLVNEAQKSPQTASNICTAARTFDWPVDVTKQSCEGTHCSIAYTLITW